MKLSFFAMLLVCGSAVSCVEPRPKVIRPPLDAVAQQGSENEQGGSRTSPQTNTTTTAPTGTGTETGGPNNQPPNPQPEPSCPTGNTCKTFTPKEIALCKLYGGGDSICEGAKWSTAMYTGVTNAIAIGKTACTINNGDVNLRKIPSLDSSAVIEKVPQGTIVEKLANDQTKCNIETGKVFASVKYGTKEGYICGTGLTCL